MRKTMLVESHYFNDGALRASWIFASPNQFGAFVATCLPVFWGAQQLVWRRRQGPGVAAKCANGSRFSRARSVTALFIVLAALELCLWFLLAKSGSRGAAVAALGAGLWWVGSSFFGRERRLGRMVGWLALRVAACVAGLLLLSAASRFSPTYVSQDRSIGNRTILWAGGAQLIAAAPLHGWGNGDSGFAFLQWVQPFDRPERYKTMVNAYITVGVEKGLPACWAVLALAAAICLWSVHTESASAQRFAMLGRSASCVAMAWALANAFSTLADDWRLWVIPTLAIIVLLVSVPYARQRNRWILWGMTVFLTSTIPLAAFVVWGKTCEVRSGLALRKVGLATVRLSSGTSADSVRSDWAIVPDIAVLGGNYGQEIRRWALAEAGTPWSATVFDPRHIDGTVGSVDAERWLLFGEAAWRADEIPAGACVVFVHPRGQVPRRWRGRGTIIFPEIDEEGIQPRWRAWADQNGLACCSITRVGTEAVAQWPKAYQDALATASRIPATQ